MSDMNANSDIAFVRHDTIPEREPPLGERGIIKWLRENLFSSITNGVLTVLALWAIYNVLTFSLPWVLNGVWDAPSIRECRTILDGATGGCFAVLSERWNQLLFGFQYPADQYWRPTLAFFLLFLAFAPVMFFNLPRNLLYFTGLYPFVAFWLIWGGSIWVPIAALAGFLFGYLVYSRFISTSFAAAFFGAIVGALVFWWVIGFITPTLSSIIPINLEFVESRQVGGFMLNMILGVVCLSLALPLGIALALGRQSDMPIIKWICVVFIEFIRGVPLITLLFVANVVLAYFLPPEANFDLIVRVIIMITLFAAAYIAEVIRGGLAALPTGQYEAADSLGLDYPQAMRLIILPQALKISIPGIVSACGKMINRIACG